MIPDMSDVLEEFEQTVKLKTVTETKSDFVRSQSVSISNIEAVVQVADKEQLQIDSIDWSKMHILVHSSSSLSEGQFIEWQGKDFKLTRGGGNWSDYGYYEFIGAETLKPLLVES